ncbi:MAG: cytochrome c [Rhodobacterales bacterium]|nr:cytochrome c [Rhodobacterales bacterium]MDX5500517.1 cytochrome c [Rhodobacterales bacterium]
MTRSLTLVTSLFLAMPAAAQAPDVGKRLYEESCAGCHGASGKGGGEIAGLLSVQTPDLTGLASRNDGTFPMLQVIHIIDGRTGLRAHGGPMPVFGSLYSSSSMAGPDSYGAVVEVHGRILALAKYLESIQQ